MLRLGKKLYLTSPEQRKLNLYSSVLLLFIIFSHMITLKMFRNSLLFSFDLAGLPRHVGIEPGVKLTRTRAEVGRQAGTAQYNRFTDHCTVGRFAPVQERESLLSGGIL